MTSTNLETLVPQRQSEKGASAECHDERLEIGPAADEKLVAWLHVLGGICSYVNTS